MKGKIFKIILVLFLFALLIVWYHNVPKKVSQADVLGLEEIFGESQIDGSTLSFEEQIDFIDRMVKILHSNYAVGVPIAYNLPREPAQLILNGGGLCYDFSRTIEKYLLYSGFETRHVAVYLKHGSFWNTITLQGVYSHSLSEVKTAKGWMIIDSNVKFYALDEDSNIYSYEDLAQLKQMPKWKLIIGSGLAPFYMTNVQFVYGLYSRHGGFYKPYNFIPDYNLRELFYNF